MPEVPAQPGPRWSGWGNDRNDAAVYGRLASLLGPRLHPVRPLGRKARRIKGQIPLFPSERRRPR